MARNLRVLQIAAVSVSVALAQSVFDAFEVAAIKPTPEDWRGGRFIRMESAHRLVARNHTLKTLVAAAYNVNPHAISGGPGWVDSEHFDIIAKVPGDARPNLAQQMAMMRALLADRFKFTMHREQKELRYYALTVAKGGSKLKDSTFDLDAHPEGPPLLAFTVAPGSIQMHARYATMYEFASVMQRAALENPVVDQTGLAGEYDFELEFTPDASLFGGAFTAPVETDDKEKPKPGMFVAIREQLGLRLEATKGPIETIVIDRAERPSDG